MINWGLRARLIISFWLVTTLTLLILGGYSLWYFYQHNLNTLKSNLLSQAKTIEHLIPKTMNQPQDKMLIDRVIKQLDFRTNIRVTIINPDGTVVADSVEIPALMENHADRPEVIAALSGEEGSAMRFSTTLKENALYMSVPLYHGSSIIGVVRTSESLAQIEAGFDKIKWALLAACLFTLILAIVLSFHLARKYSEPLEIITNAANDIASGKLDRRIHVRTGDEIEILGHALNNLASNLEDHVNEIIAEKKKLELILQHMANPVILLDRFGRVTMVNKMAAETFGIVASMMGQHNIQVIGNSQLDRLVHLSIEKRTSRLIDLKTNIKGAKRVFQVFLEPIISSEQEITGVLCVFHDITTLQEIHERQSDFIANASHELATPLTSIKGFAETLLDGAMEQPEINEKFIRIIYEEADRMQRLVQDLLQLAKLDSQEYRQQLKLEPTKIPPVIEAVIEELRPHWERKDIIISVDDPYCQLEVIANYDWIKQILVNLVENGIKYTPEHGKVFIRCWEKEDYGYVAVQDTGMGIPTKDLPLIFDRFYRVDRARTRSAGGTGLGLAIVKFIVEMLGGKIEVKSNVDLGTTFTFRLPLAEKI